MIKRQSFVIILKLIVLFLTTVGLSYAIFLHSSLVFSLLIGLLLIVEAMDFVHFFDAQNRKLAFFFEAICNEDTTLIFSEQVKDKSLRALHTSLNNLNRKISDIKIKNETNERFFRELIEHSTTGLMSVDQDGYVELINSSAKKYLGIVQLSNISLLHQKNPLLYDTITEILPGEKKTIKTMVAKEPVSLSVQSSELKFGDKTFKLISLQDIGHELEENEIDSWQKLIRVMTHEIMNSIAPITSLTQTLQHFFRADGVPKRPEAITESDISNTLEGLSVIKERGNGLIHFVDNYRKLAKVPKPVFAPLELKQWAHGIGLLFQPEFQNRDIHFSMYHDPSATTLLTDEKLLDQVMINLMTNAIDALSCLTSLDEADTRVEASHTPGKIQLTIRNTPSGNVQIELSDNGCGIDDSLLDRIFVPFFTTKEGGNGIGLSLSRQIVRKLNGKLFVHSVKNQGSRFVVEI